MKVYIVTGEPFPNGMAATQRIKCYAKALISTGIKCEIIIFRRTELYGHTPRNTEGIGIFEGIHYRYIGGTPLRGNNVFFRKFDDWSDERKSVSYLNENLNKGDVIFLFCGGYVEYSLQLIDLAHNKEALIVRDVCELPYGTESETQKTIRKRKITLEKQFPKLDGFVCISEPLINLAQNYGSPNAKFVKIPILVDYDKYFIEDRSFCAEVPYIFHSGTLFEQKDGILGMIEAFGKAAKHLNKPVKFILTGKIESSPHRDEIKKLIQQYNLTGKVIFTGYLSNEELKEKLSKAALVIINKYITQQNHFCFSTKLGEYLAAGKPVVITQVGEAMNYLENEKSAIVIPPDDNDALAKAIVDAFIHTDRTKQIGIEGRNVCKSNFDYRTQSEILKNFMYSLDNYLN